MAQIALVLLLLVFASLLSADPGAPDVAGLLDLDSLILQIDEKRRSCPPPKGAADVETLRAEVNNASSDAERSDRLGLLADALAAAGDLESALDAYDEAEFLADWLENRRSIADLKGRRGLALRSASRYCEALQSFREAVTLAIPAEDQDLSIRLHARIASVQELRGRYAEALAGYEAALDIARPVGEQNPALLASLEGDHALVQSELGRHDEARQGFQRALDLATGLASDRGRAAVEARTRHNFGVGLSYLGDYHGAIERFREALAVRLDACDLSGVATSAGSLGYCLTKVDQCESALPILERALELSRRADQRFAVGRTLDSIGSGHLCLNNLEQASERLLEALAVAGDIDDRSGKYQALLHLADLAKRRKEPRLEIFYLKRSVNILERVRAENGGLSDKLRDGFDRSVAESYRRLAELLVADGRVFEARQVIELIQLEQIDELFKGIDRPQTAADFLPLNTPEHRIWGEEQERLGQVIDVGRQIRNLERRQETECAESSGSDECGNLWVQIQAAWQRQAAAQAALTGLLTGDAVAHALSRQPDPVQLENLKILRSHLPTGSMLLYPLLLEDKTIWILATRGWQQYHAIEGLTRSEVVRQVKDLRALLANPRSDPIPAASELYRRLLAPIRDAIEAEQVKKLVYVPDGELRYLPLGALRGGKRWLAEDFSVLTLSGQSLGNLGDPRSPIDKVITAAFDTKGHSLTVGDKVYEFAPLVGAKREADDISRRFGGGVVRLSQQGLTAAAVHRFKYFRVVHLATHGLFTSGGDDDASFVLMGDGSRATMSKILRWELGGVDLVVLSACQTGVGGLVASGGRAGREILGLGHAVQQAGAKAVMATLWPVDDAGTETLMHWFYEALHADPSSPADSLQAAQKCLIGGNCPGTQGRFKVERGALPIGDAPRDPRLEYPHHPYYWAPFFIIGNG